jgi:hypothetical protein
MPGRWLRHENHDALFEILVAGALNVAFLALLFLFLWPLDKLAFGVRLAKGYGVLWAAATVTIILIHRIHRLFRVDLYRHPDAYVLSNLAVSCLLQTGWAAYAALAVRSVLAGAPVSTAAALYFLGLLSCLIAFFAVSTFYQGHIYRLVSLPLAAAGFIVFSAWPASGSMMYGWFFDLL